MKIFNESFNIISKVLLQKEGIHSLFLKRYEGLTLPVTWLTKFPNFVIAIFLQKIASFFSDLNIGVSKGTT